MTTLTVFNVTSIFLSFPTLYSSAYDVSFLPIKRFARAYSLDPSQKGFIIYYTLKWKTFRCALKKLPRNLRLRPRLYTIKFKHFEFQFNQQSDLICCHTNEQNKLLQATRGNKEVG